MIVQELKYSLSLKTRRKPLTFVNGFFCFYSMNPNTAVILVNTGTPDSPQVKDVRKYLRQFLGDKRVINLPWIFRKALVNLIISPVRGPKSAKLYSKIWTTEGSPLLVNSINFSKALQARLNGEYHVYTAMRYGNPSLESIVKDVLVHGFTKVIVVPVYPQYAESTTGSIFAEYERLSRKYKLTATTKLIEPFFRNQGFIGAFAAKINTALKEVYDHVIFSFHGLPVKQTEKMHPGFTCLEAGCMHEVNNRNEKCYYASCYATARMLAQSTGLYKDNYTVSFQSRLGMNWLKPYTDDVLKQNAARGAKKVLIVSPAFVADCLETIYELGVEYKELFRESGGLQLTLVESLNDDPLWVEAMVKIIKESDS
jgi:protoporphyrin/coproporphyrin ferrochelatase